mmetsp:Transcript_21908/g.62358  ORF Transcript_21908/g.62358 Transcript_21908/m.62358 type:complete len:232 (-) Transcript_21908:969-1664(-)
MCVVCGVSESGVLSVTYPACRCTLLVQLPLDHADELINEFARVVGAHVGAALAALTLTAFATAGAEGARQTGGVPKHQHAKRHGSSSLEHRQTRGLGACAAPARVNELLRGMLYHTLSAPLDALLALSRAALVRAVPATFLGRPLLPLRATFLPWWDLGQECALQKQLFDVVFDRLLHSFLPLVLPILAAFAIICRILAFASQGPHERGRLLLLLLGLIPSSIGQHTALLE